MKITTPNPQPSPESAKPLSVQMRTVGARLAETLHEIPIRPAVPLGLARSALFSVSRHSGGKSVDNEAIAITPLRGSRLSYSGPRLNQYHALVWQAVIQAATADKVITDEPFSVSADALLRAMGGQGNDSKQRERLWRWLRDLTGARIEYSTIAHDYAGPLVFEAARDKAKQRLVIRLNPRLIQLLGNEVLENDLARKAALGRNLLALWLHDYYATHLRPPANSVATLHAWCGSPLALPQFRQRLRPALDLLGRGSHPLLLCWAIDRRDRVIVEKAATLVKILGKRVVTAKQVGAHYENRKRDDIEQAQKRRARVAL